MRIGILGPLEVRDPDGRLLPVAGARLRSLVIRLAISDGRPVPVDTLADDLWPGGGPADAGNALQALVSRLRAVAGKAFVEYGPTGYRLAVPSGEIDAFTFERLVRAALAPAAGEDTAGEGSGRRRQGRGPDAPRPGAVARAGSRRRGRRAVRGAGDRTAV